MQSTLRVLPCIGTTEKEVLRAATDGHSKITCCCGNGANLYNRFGGNIASRGLFEELAMDSAADPCSKQRMGGHNHDKELTEDLTKSNGAVWSGVRTMNLRFVI